MTVASICSGLALLSLGFTLVAHATAFWLVSPRRRRSDGYAPPLSILKPVKGADDGLFENLCSLARQDYPDYQLIIGAADPRDPALEVARRVQAAHPRVRITVVAGCRPLGLNPKVNLLAALAEHARWDHVLISDSNVRASPAYLRETAAELADPGVALVTNLLVGEETDGLGGILENLHLNSFVASAASFARVLGGRACVIGKSMLFRRSDLDLLGGFATFSDVLAEDYLIGRAFELFGFKVAVSPHVLTTVNRGWTLERFANRHLRWAQMRRRLCLPAYLGELLFNPVVWVVLAACASAGERSQARTATTWAAAVALKCGGDALLSARLRGRPERLRNVLLIPAKDLLMAGFWCVGAFRRTIDWRGNRLRIESGSRLVADPRHFAALAAGIEDAREAA
ncbi:MAG: ceramide glucosyltransferase [Myxococcales bacterium]